MRWEHGLGMLRRVALLSALLFATGSCAGHYGDNRGERLGDSMVEAVFAPFAVRNLVLEPLGGRVSLSSPALRHTAEAIQVVATGGFVLRGAVEKDLSGYEGVQLEIEAPGGSLVVEIEDCFGSVWSNQWTLSRRRQVLRYGFSDFEPVHLNGERHLGEPASVETLALKFQPESEKEFSFHWRSFSPYGSKGLAGPSISIDPLFQFYQEREWEETARLVQGEGYTNAVIVLTRVLPDAEHRRIVGAFHHAGLKCSLRINPPTDFEAYEEHPEWRQRMIDGSSRHDWRVYLCPNEEEFADYYCSKVARVLQTAAYDALLISELWFEVWGGPYPGNPSRGKYACLCDACARAFEERAGIHPRGLFDESSPSYFEKPCNAPLYQAWCDFRVESINALGRRITEAAREARPGLSIGYMYLSDCAVEPGKTREYQAQDLEGALAATGAEIAVIQDAWQDWTQQALSPDFVRAYAEAYLRRARTGHRDRVVQVHADVGSLSFMRRSGLWMRRLSAEARLSGFDSPMYYEFSLNRSGDGKATRR